MSFVLPQAVIGLPSEFTEKHRRVIRFLVKRAVDQGLLHERDPEWADEIIELHGARGIINDGKLTAFCVLRRMGHGGEFFAYGEACLWKGGNGLFRTQAQYVLLDEGRRLGDVTRGAYGAFYSGNDMAREFYAPEHGYRYVSSSELPEPLFQELETYLDEITLLHNPLTQDLRAVFGLDSRVAETMAPGP